MNFDILTDPLSIYSLNSRVSTYLVNYSYFIVQAAEHEGEWQGSEEYAICNGGLKIYRIVVGIRNVFIIIVNIIHFWKVMLLVRDRLLQHLYLV